MEPTLAPADAGREIQAAVAEIMLITDAALKSQLTPTQQEQLETIRRLADSAAQLLNNVQLVPKATTATSASAEAPAIDWPAALQRARNNELLLRETARRFVGECPRLLEQIQSALAANNRAEVRRVANKLKTAAGIFAARATVEAAAHLEQIEDEQPAPEPESAFQTLRAEADMAVAQLQRFVETGVR